MSYSDVLTRVSALEAMAQRALAPVVQPVPATTPQVGLRFETALDDALGTPSGSSVAGLGSSSTCCCAACRPTALPALAPVTGGGSQTGLRALAAASAEVGVSEEPPGSNEGARIAEYRSAVAGSYGGAPWCAYFVSWAAAQAGVPLGEQGEGFGAVEQIADWAGRTGRLVPAGQAPAPGDLILFGGRHVGIVESVAPDGSLTTVEGNESNAVTRRQRSQSEATGYVRL